MKPINLLATTMLVSVLSGTAPAMAAAPVNSTSPTATNTSIAAATPGRTANPQASDQQLQVQSSEILGNIGIANIALTYGLNDDASSHINAARKAIAQFNSQMTSYKSSTPMTAGKLSYKSAKGNSDYWIPVLNDRFVVRTLDGTHLNSKNPDIDVTDAQTVHYQMFLDTKVADQQLAKAQDAMSNKQYDVAMNALQNVTKGAITEMAVQDRPFESARDNLILAKELLQDKDYKGASFALKHANTNLAQAEKENPKSADNAKFTDMQSQITSLQASIDKREPSMLKTAEMKIDGWIKDVKEKIHS